MREWFDRRRMARQGPARWPRLPEWEEPARRRRPAGSGGIPPSDPDRPSGAARRPGEVPAARGARRGRGQRLLLVALLLILVVAAGCGRPQGPAGSQRDGGEAGAAGDRLPVAVTFYPLEFMTRFIGGDRVAVTPLIPAGADAHHWEPRPADVRAVAAARVFIYNGAGLEPWVPRLLAAAGRSDLVRVEATAGLPLVPAGTATAVLDGGVAEPGAGGAGEGGRGGDAGGETGGHGDHGTHEEGRAAPGDDHGDAHGRPGAGGEPLPGGAPDPHVWLDPALAAQQAQAIARGLAQADPQHRAEYLRRGEELAGRLNDLAAGYRRLGTCPRRELVITHAFLTYPAHRYGLVQVPLYGLSAESEPGPRQLAAVAAFIRQRRVPYILVEPGRTGGAAATLARETGAQLLEIHPLEALTSADRQAGRDFLDLLQQNLVSLRQALGCDGS
ncbi:zinc ABC transporter solute-binding protein [Thermaerobacter sp. PB12/4term]|nr:zinc ABC transporter solute-binding protein [Thermaerobacter sp. PB12/4term]